MKRHIVYGAPLWETPLLTLDNMPASAQHTPGVRGIKQDRGLTLDLRQCMGYGLIQFDYEPVDYYRDMIRAGGFSKIMAELYRYRYKHLIESYYLEGKKFIGVGYGQGEFLRVLSELPVEVHGIEHDPHLAKLARTQRLDVTKGFTETGDTWFTGRLYDVFLSFNSLEHQSDPGTILQVIYRNLEGDAIGLIVVPGFEYIMDHDSYYKLIRDHLAYYTFETLTPLSEHNGFPMGECEVINRDALSAIVKKRPQMNTENLLECYVNPKRGVEFYIKYLDAWDKRVAVRGVSHQGSTLASTIKLGERARHIISSAPFKQGRFTPASRLPIVGPGHFHERPVDAIIITAPGYTDEIAASTRRKFGTPIEIRATCSNHLEVVQEG